MIINIIDPGLIATSGHHLDIDQKLMRELLYRGHQLRLYIHRHAATDVLSAIPSAVEVHPVLAFTPYVRPESLDPYAGPLLSFQWQTESLAKILHNMASADRVLFPSLFAAHLNACANARLKIPVSGCVHVPTSSLFSQDPMFWRLALLNSQAAGLSLHLGALEPALLPQYQMLAEPHVRFQHFPPPYDASSPAKVQSPALRTVGFFGHQRQEKGLHLLGETVQRLLQDGLDVLMHDPKHQAQWATWPRVRAIAYTDDLAAVMEQCDCIVLPYDVEGYAHKGSGILWQAMASGIPVLAPEATAPGKFLAQRRAGLVFANNTPDDIVEAVRLARQHYPALAQQCQTSRLEWSREFGIKPFCDAMLGTPQMPISMA